MPDLSPVDVVRLLVNDPNDANSERVPVFSDAEVNAYLGLESGSVKRAAAQALDVIASDQALVLKVITDRGLTMDGPKVADALRKHAAALRSQADRADADDDDTAGEGGYFAVTDFTGPGWPELASHGATPVYQPTSPASTDLDGGSP